MITHIISLGRCEGQYVLDPGRFNNEYRGFEDTFYEDRLQYVAIAPLQAMLMEDVIVTLSDSLEIRRLIKEEMEPYRIPQSSWRAEWCAVRAKYTIPKLVGSNNRRDGIPLEEQNKQRKKEQAEEEGANDRIEDVINALRLYGKFTVYHADIIHLPPKWLFLGSHSVPNRMLGESIVTYPFGSSRDVQIFPQFWGKLETPRVRKELMMAVRRFSYSCVRHLNEDRIIDLMIAAEALFLRGSREGEKRFRLAFRAGRFLGSDPTSQKQIYDRMKKAYDLRSTLVHGGSAPYLRQLRGEITENDELINLVADNVRNAILQALDIVSSPQGTALDDTYWDRIIFS